MVLKPMAERKYSQIDQAIRERAESGIWRAQGRDLNFERKVGGSARSESYEKGSTALWSNSIRLWVAVGNNALFEQASCLLARL